MFVRLKDPQGNNITLVASKIVAFAEGAKSVNNETGEPIEGTVTVVFTDQMQYAVVESERVIRSKILKAVSGDTAE